MNKIEKKSYGYKITLAGSVSPDEMLQWVAASKEALTSSPPKFGVVVDMRDLKPLTPEAQNHMQEGQKLYKGKGMTRSAVIVASAVLAMQFKRIANETGIYEWERYVSAAQTSDFEKVAENWVSNGVDPDKK